MEGYETRDKASQAPKRIIRASTADASVRGRNDSDCQGNHDNDSVTLANLPGR
jgi:hypothetical protein